MTWTKAFPGFRLDPIAEGAPDALVVLLHEPAATDATLTNVASCWAPMMPTTAFIAVERNGAFALPDDGFDSSAGTDPRAQLITLDHAARRLETLIRQHARTFGIEARRLVLAGFGSGGTLALWLSMREAWHGAGVLAIGARLALPFPQPRADAGKIRLIECLPGKSGSSSALPDAVALFRARGIDVRGAVLTASCLSDDAARHGGAYLAELVATAQQGVRARPGQEDPA